jgi:hypothetical protein
LVEDAGLQPLAQDPFGRVVRRPEPPGLGQSGLAFGGLEPGGGDVERLDRGLGELLHHATDRLADAVVFLFHGECSFRARGGGRVVAARRPIGPLHER